MTPPNLAYSTALMVAGLICLLVGLIVVQTRRNALGAIPLTILMFSLSWWDITYSLFWAKAPAPFPNFWLYITYVGAMTVPEALLAFAMQLSGLQDLLKMALYHRLVRRTDRGGCTSIYGFTAWFVFRWERYSQYRHDYGFRAGILGEHYFLLYSGADQLHPPGSQIHPEFGDLSMATRSDPDRHRNPLAQ